MRVDRKPTANNACLQQHNIVVHSVNNTVVWTDAGAYPCLPIPPGWPLITDIAVWNNAIAQ